LPRVSWLQIDTGSKFAAGINYTSGTDGKFVSGVIDTGAAVHLDLRISP